MRKVKGVPVFAFVIAAALVLALLVGGVVVFAAEDIKLLIQGKEKYARNIMKDAVTVAAADTLDYVAEYEQTLGADGTTGNLNFSFGCDVNDLALNLLINNLGLDYGEEDILRLLAVSKFEVGMDYDLDQKDPKLDLTIKWFVAGNELITLNGKLIDNIVYIRSPELYGKAFVLDLSELGMNASALVEQFTAGAMEGADPMEMVRRVASTVSKNNPVLKNMCRDVAEAFLKEIKTIDYVKKADVEINGKIVRINKCTVQLDDRSAIQGVTAALDVILQNKQYVNAIAAVADSVASNMDDYAAPIRPRDVEDALNNFRELVPYMMADDVVVWIDLYARRPKDIAGVRVAWEDKSARQNAEFGFVYNDGTGYEAWGVNAYNNVTETEVRVFGNLSTGSAGASGDMRVSYKQADGNGPGGMQSFSAKICDFENLKTEKISGAKVPTAKFTFYPGQIVRDLSTSGEMLDPDLIAALRDSIVTMTVSAKGKGVQTDLSFRGSGIELTCSFAGEQGTAFNSVAPPESELVRISIMSIMFGNMPDIDVQELMANLFTIAGKLESAGINADWLTNAVQEGLQYVF